MAIYTIDETSLIKSTFRICSLTTVEELKTMIKEEGKGLVLQSLISLYYEGKTLDPERTLSSYGVSEDSTLQWIDEAGMPTCLEFTM